MTKNILGNERLHINKATIYETFNNARSKRVNIYKWVFMMIAIVPENA